MASWREQAGPARGIGAAINATVTAAADRDPVAYQDESARLAGLPSGPVGLVLGAVVRMLLEEQHPDGLDGDDIQTVFARCYRSAAGWLPPDRVEPAVLVAVLAAALGVQEPGVTYQEIVGAPADDPPRGHVFGGSGTGAATAPLPAPTADAYAWHAPLVAADLLAAGRARIGRYLDAAFTEIARDETMEQP